MRVALDTNLLVYAEGYGDERRCQRARKLIAQLDPSEVVLPAQVLGELFNVLTRKAGRTPDAAKSAVLSWSDAFDIAQTDRIAIASACDLAHGHQLPFWDALILSLAAQQKCRLLLSEDFSQGFTWQGVTIVNPLLSPAHDLLSLLSKR